jgi:hypothetical protein
MSVLFLVLAACGGSAGDGANLLPDAPSSGADAGASSDGAPFQGLVVSWEDAPAIPGPQNTVSMIDVTSAKFHIEKLEAISDGGADPSATQQEFDVAWSAVASPADIFFFSAPPAIYSKIRLSIDAGPANAPSIEITGTVQVNGSTEMFRVTSMQSAALEVSGYAVTLGLGEAEGMPIIVGLDVLLADVDWMALPLQNGVRTLDDTRSTEMTAFFGYLEYTFTGPLE